MKYLIFIASFISFSQVYAQDTPAFIGCWTDSREERMADTDLSIYRPCDYKEFPASRYRFTMEINEDNTCSWLHLAANDAHYMKDGTWTFDGKNSTLVIFDESQKEIKRFEIEYMDEHILKVTN